MSIFDDLLSEVKSPTVKPAVPPPVERVPVVGVAPVVERAIPTGVRSAAEEAAEELWWQTSWIMQTDRNTRVLSGGLCSKVKK